MFVSFRKTPFLCVNKRLIDRLFVETILAIITIALLTIAAIRAAV